MTNTEWLRQRILSRLDSPVGNAMEPFEELQLTEWSSEFEQLMRNRLLLGRFRYGKMGDPTKAEYDHIGSIRTRLDLFEETGNLEHLVDIANLCLVEFVHTKHPLAHFAAIDDGIHCETRKA